MVDDPNPKISKLIEAWCDRREYGALASVLPAWISNNGLTDGWAMLHDALRHTYGFRHLPDHEREILKDVYVAIDLALRNR